MLKRVPNIKFDSIPVSTLNGDIQEKGARLLNAPISQQTTELVERIMRDADAKAVAFKESRMGNLEKARFLFFELVFLRARLEDIAEELSQRPASVIPVSTEGSGTHPTILVKARAPVTSLPVSPPHGSKFFDFSAKLDEVKETIKLCKSSPLDVSLDKRKDTMRLAEEIRLRRPALLTESELIQLKRDLLDSAPIASALFEGIMRVVRRNGENAFSRLDRARFMEALNAFDAETLLGITRVITDLANLTKKGDNAPQYVRILSYILRELRDNKKVHHASELILGGMDYVLDASKEKSTRLKVSFWNEYGPCWTAATRSVELCLGKAN